MNSNLKVYWQPSRYSRNPNLFIFQIIIQLLTLRVDDCQMLAKLDVMDNYNIFLF